MSTAIHSIFSFFSDRSRQFFLLGITLVVIGLVFSKALISIGSFVLLGSWIIEGNILKKFRLFFQNKLALSISLIYIVHLLGLIYTTDFEYAMKDLRIKIPLLLFPLLLATSKPLSSKEFHFFQVLFVLATFVATLVSIWFLVFGPESYHAEKRNLSLFISHIRFSLMICLSFFISIQSLFRTTRPMLRMGIILTVIWFPVFLFIVESFTGIAILSISTVVYVLLQIKKKRKKVFFIGMLSAFTMAIFYGLFHLTNLYHEFQDAQEVKDLPHLQVTEKGEIYSHPALYDTAAERQNGYVIYQNIAWDEMIATWNERSHIDFDSSTNNQYPIRHVILWYLTSKGLPKDAQTISALSDQEVNAIENGISNVMYMNRPGFEVRLLQTFWEVQNYLRGGDVNGHSITMRWIFWQTAYRIFKPNWLFGVGTGDIKKAFAEQYDRDQSSLEKRWRLRSHNQYLSVAVTFGITGLLIFLYALFFPIVRHRNDIMYVIFSTILLLSMINEDTLETQTGVTLFAFFNAFYLFLSPSEEALSKSS